MPVQWQIVFRIEFLERGNAHLDNHYYTYNIAPGLSDQAMLAIYDQGWQPCNAKCKAAMRALCTRWVDIDMQWHMSFLYWDEYEHIFEERTAVLCGINVYEDIRRDEK